MQLISTGYSISCFLAISSHGNIVKPIFLAKVCKWKINIVQIEIYQEINEFIYTFQEDGLRQVLEEMKALYEQNQSDV